MSNPLATLMISALLTQETLLKTELDSVSLSRHSITVVFFLATSLFYIHMSFQQEAISDTHPRSSLNSISFVYIINPLLAFVDTESSLFLCPAKSQPQLNLMLKNEQKYHPVNNRTFL